MQAHDGSSEVCRQPAMTNARADGQDIEAAFSMFGQGLDRLMHVASSDVIWDLAATFYDAAESVQVGVSKQLDEAGVTDEGVVDLSALQAEWAKIISGRKT